MYQYQHILPNGTDIWSLENWTNWLNLAQIVEIGLAHNRIGVEIGLAHKPFVRYGQNFELWVFQHEIPSKN